MQIFQFKKIIKLLIETGSNCNPLRSSLDVVYFGFLVRGLGLRDPGVALFGLKHSKGVKLRPSLHFDKK